MNRSLWVHVVVMACVAVPTTAPGAPGSPACLEFETIVQPGDSVTVNAGNGVWLELQTRLDRVYRIEVAATRDVVLDFWTLDFDEGDQCYVLDRKLSSRNVDAPGEVFEWTDPGPPAEAVWVADTEVGAPVSVTLTLEEIAAPPTAEVIVIPAVARVHGAGGELFQSDVSIFNTSAVERTAEIILVPGVSGERHTVTTTIGPRQVLNLVDVVGETFGLDESVGALRVECAVPCRLLGASRTYASTADGTYGQFIPALPWPDAAGQGSSGPIRRILHLEKSADFRSNVGFVEVLGLDAIVELTLRDETGTTLATASTVIDGNSHRQINDIFAFLGVDAVDAAQLEIEVGSQARVFAYGSVVDNVSSDPVFVTGLAPDRGLPWTHDAGTNLTVPAAAATPGHHGTVWRTDLRVLAPDGESPVVDITFRPHDGRPPATAPFPAQAGGILAIDDVVSRLQSRGSGVLELSCVNGSMLATTRTYTIGSRGSYGQFIPALATFIDLDRGTVLDLRKDGRFRSNVGLVNPNANPVTVTLELRSPLDELLATRAEFLGPHQATQINDIFGSLGVAGCASCRLDYRVEAESGRDDVLVYGSVIDNRSGDPVFIPGQSF